MTPTLSKTGQRLYDSVEALTRDEAANGFPLAYYVNGYGQMLDPVLTLVSEQDDGTPGFAWLFDPDTAPAGWLPYLEFFTGVNPYPAVDEAGRRLRIKETDGRRRGTPKAIKGAARQFLTGTQTVFIITRDSGPYHYTVVTRQAETPMDSAVSMSWDAAPGMSWDSAATAATWNSGDAGGDVFPSLVWEALNEQKPAGFNFTLVVAAGQVWDEVLVGTTWDSVAGTVLWNDLVGSTTI